MKEEEKVGMMDAINPEDRIQIKYSEFKALVKAEAKAELIITAINNFVPHEYIQGMLYKDHYCGPVELKEEDQNGKV